MSGRPVGANHQEARQAVGFVCLAGFVACVFGANWFISHVGTQPYPGGPHTLPVGVRGLRAPSGFVWVGISLALRDIAQRLLGARWTLAGIVAGAGLSALVSPSLALASGFTFLVAESLDFAVFTPLQRWNLIGAGALSNVVGAVVDSVLFLTLAFGWSSVSQFAEAQIVGKILWSLPFLAVLPLTRRRLVVA